VVYQEMGQTEVLSLHTNIVKSYPPVACSSADELLPLL
jgi:hypothetical protein